MEALIIFLIVAVVILFVFIVILLHANEQLREELGMYKYREYQEIRERYREFCKQIGEQLNKEIQEEQK